MLCGQSFSKERNLPLHRIPPETSQDVRQPTIERKEVGWYRREMNRMERLGRNHAKSVEKLWEKVMKEDNWTSPTQTLEKWARRCEKQEALIEELLEALKELEGAQPVLPDTWEAVRSLIAKAEGRE